MLKSVVLTETVNAEVSGTNRDCDSQYLLVPLTIVLVKRHQNIEM